MGGNAFANRDPPLETPRLAPEVYYPLRDQYIALLKSLYRYVDTPIEGPGKADFGDIDIIVAEPLDPSPNDTNGTTITATGNGKLPHARYSLSAHHIPAVSELLKPVCTLHDSNSPTTCFALHHPFLHGCYVQLDVHVCTTRRQWLWMLFKHAHGDMWNLLGTSLRPFGLTASDEGLYVRDPVIDAFDRKRSMIYLTDAPAEVLELMGYSEQEFWEGGKDPLAGFPFPAAPGEGEDWRLQHAQTSSSRQFPSVEAMFAFVIRSRFFRKRFYPRESLKANDRKRMAQRPAFRRFVNEFVPALLDHGVATEGAEDQRMAREVVLEEVLGKFDKREEWLALRAAWDVEREELDAKRTRRVLKKEIVREEIAYADAWIRELEGGPFTE